MHRHHASSTVRASITADGLVLLDTERGLVFAANPIGARIWQLLADGVPSDTIAERLATEYEVAIDTAAHDVRAFVASLVGRGLLHLGDSR